MGMVPRSEPRDVAQAPRLLCRMRGGRRPAQGRPPRVPTPRPREGEATPALKLQHGAMVHAHGGELFLAGGTDANPCRPCRGQAGTLTALNPETDQGRARFACRARNKCGLAAAAAPGLKGAVPGRQRCRPVICIKLPAKSWGDVSIPANPGLQRGARVPSPDCPILRLARLRS